MYKLRSTWYDLTMNITPRGLAVIVAVGLAAGGVIGALNDTAPLPPPCKMEDSAGPCYWDAERRGNGEGRSFVVNEDNTVYYLETK